MKIVNNTNDTLKDFLEFFYEDIDVQLAKNGSEATALVNNESFQILISDQMMPDMKGSEFINNTIEGDELVKLINYNIKEYRYHLGKSIEMQYVPQIKFYYDNTYEEIIAKNTLILDGARSRNMLRKVG